MSYNHIIVELNQKVGIITLNRPQAHNALCKSMMKEVAHVLTKWESDSSINVAILTGGNEVFAAGADIKEMQNLSFADVYSNDFIHDWEIIASFPKPIIAAVAGYALGGGCEIALMCDMIIAAETAVFGQPEITLGVMPGAGATQRLTGIVGKTRAMELCLTARFLKADEAKEWGLVNRVISPLDLMPETLKIAAKIASFSQPVMKMIKKAIQSAEETPLSVGIKMERQLFHSTFATADQKEGMQAFLEKRSPNFKNK